MVGHGGSVPSSRRGRSRPRSQRTTADESRIPVRSGRQARHDSRAGVGMGQERGLQSVLCACQDTTAGNREETSQDEEAASWRIIHSVRRPAASRESRKTLAVLANLLSMAVAPGVQDRPPCRLGQRGKIVLSPWLTCEQPTSPDRAAFSTSQRRISCQPAAGCLAIEVRPCASQVQRGTRQGAAEVAAV